MGNRKGRGRPNHPKISVKVERKTDEELEGTNTLQAEADQKPAMQQAESDQPQTLFISEDTLVAPKRKNDKRKTAFWDSLYTGRPSALLVRHDWDFTNNKGPSSLVFDAAGLAEYVKNKRIKRYTCRGIRFQSCDIEGDFSVVDVTFSKCTFTKCDFGESRWREAKFSECVFDECSLTLAEFESCQFYKCDWRRITVSGTETKLVNTLITNPDGFIRSLYTNLDRKVLEAKNTTPQYQSMRLEKTKLKMARLINKGAEGYGDEFAYYESVKTKINQSIKASMVEALYDFRTKKERLKNTLKILGGAAEYAILNCSAFINAWGRSIVRPTLLGLMIMLVFGVCYGGQLGDYKQGVIQGFDITFLIGYTKYANASQGILKQSLYALNAFLGLWWYAILVPTLINRLNRSG